jgi:mxaD protein
MTSLHVTERFAYPAEAVWTLIGDFGGLHRWNPQVRRLDLSWEGRIRTLHYADGGRAVERLEARNDAAHRYAYVLVDGSLPVQACRSTLEVCADGEGCVVVWSCVFEPMGDGEHEAEVALRRYYDAGLVALAAAVGAV